MVAAVLSSGSTVRWTTEERPVCAVTSCSVCGAAFKLVSHPAKKTKDITKTTDRNTLLIVMVLISSLQMFKTLVQPSGQTCVPSQALPEPTPGRLCRVPLPGLQSVFVGVSSESVARRLNNNQGNDTSAHRARRSTRISILGFAVGRKCTPDRLAMQCSAPFLVQ